MKSRSEAIVPTDQPWLERTDWADGRVGSSDRRALVGLVVFAVIWNLVSIPLVFTLPDEILEKGNYWACLGLLFPAVGVVLVLVILYRLIRSGKFGESIFQMASVPGVVGGSFAGVLRISVPIQPATGFQFRLSNIERRKDSDGETHEKVAWQDERIVSDALSDDSATETAVPVLFAIPYDSQPTSVPIDDGRHVWRLEVNADLPGVDYKTAFDVPVFKTPDSREDFELDENLKTSYATDPDPNLVLRQARIYSEPIPGGGVRLVFPAARNIGFACGLTIFTAIWSAAIWAMIHFGAPILFPIAFGFFELLLIVFLLDVWFYRSVVEASPHGLITCGGLLGFGERIRHAAGDIIDFKSAGTASSGTRVWSDLAVATTSEKSQTIAKWLPSKIVERAVINKINHALGRTA